MNAHMVCVCLVCLFVCLLACFVLIGRDRRSALARRRWAPTRTWTATLRCICTASRLRSSSGVYCASSTGARAAPSRLRRSLNARTRSAGGRRLNAFCDAVDLFQTMSQRSMIVVVVVAVAVVAQRLKRQQSADGSALHQRDRRQHRQRAAHTRGARAPRSASVPARRRNSAAKEARARTRRRGWRRWRRIASPGATRVAAVRTAASAPPPLGDDARPAPSLHTHIVGARLAFASRNDNAPTSASARATRSTGKRRDLSSPS